MHIFSMDKYGRCGGGSARRDLGDASRENGAGKAQERQEPCLRLLIVWFEG
jgi:hypothetical protein